jgi:spermidine synthase
MPSWYEEDQKSRTRFSLVAKQPLASAQSPYQKIDLFESEQFGVVLMLDGLFQTSERDEHFYHEMLIHPVMTSAPSIKRVLVIGGGDGGSIREVLRYKDVEHVTMCEIDGLVIDLCKQHLASFNVPWTDKRLDLRVGDGIAFMKEHKGPLFDVIIVDGSDPVGPAEGLIAESFYAACKKCLSPEGALVVQSESPIVMRDDLIRIVNNMRTVFPRVAPYLGPVPIYPSGSWSYTLASDKLDPRTPKPERLAQIEPTAKYYNRDIHVAAFALPSDLKRELG